MKTEIILWIINDFCKKCELLPLFFVWIMTFIVSKDNFNFSQQQN